MMKSEEAVVASVMRSLYSECVIAGWRCGDGYRRTRKGEWDNTVAVLDRAALTLQRLLEIGDDGSNQP